MYDATKPSASDPPPPPPPNTAEGGPADPYASFGGNRPEAIIPLTDAQILAALTRALVDDATDRAATTGGAISALIGCERAEFFGRLVALADLGYKLKVRIEAKREALHGQGPC